MRNALAGLGVVEIGRYVAGPYCAKMLSDLGADVIKVEPPSGDPSRAWRVAQETGPTGASPWFHYLNTGKRSATLDLKTAEGKETLFGLLRRADVLVQNLAPPAVDALGLAFDRVKQSNPRIIMTSISNFGFAGPERAKRASDLTLIAGGGSLRLIGEPDREPVAPGWQQASMMGGTVAFIATMAALLGRDSGAPAQHLDIAIRDCVSSHLEAALIAYAYNGVSRCRKAMRFGRGHPVGIYPCQDGHVVITPGLGGMPSLALLLGRPELEDHPMFTSHTLRQVKWKEFDSEFLLPWLGEKKKKDIANEAQALRMPFAAVLGPQDVLEDDHFQVRGALAEITVDGRTFRIPRLALTVSDLEAKPRSSPALGEHTKEVVREALEGARPANKAPPKPTASLNGTRAKPLANIRILDLSRAFAGPIATRIAADLGAQVIKVEAIQAPDMPTRESNMAENDPKDRPWERGGNFHWFGMGKMDVTLDLNKPEGLQAFLGLVASADVVVENYSPRVKRNLGIEYTTLKKLRPDLIMLSLSGYGQTGPRRDHGGYFSAMEAGGIAAVSGYPDKPVLTGVGYGDWLLGTAGAAALLVALRERQATGKGQYLDVSGQEAVLQMIGAALLATQTTGHPVGRYGNRADPPVLQGCYRCAGRDQWLCVTVADDADWISLCKTIGRKDLIDDPRLSTKEKRYQQHDFVDEAISKWSLPHSAEDAERMLTDGGVIASKAASPRDVMLRQAERLRHCFDVATHPVVGNRPYPRLLPGIFTTLEASPSGPSPLMGQHNTFALHDLLGMDDAAVSHLAAIGVTGDHPSNPHRPIPLPIQKMREEGIEVDPDYLANLSKVFGKPMGPLLAGGQSNPAAISKTEAHRPEER